jgi:hypothetical protein
MAHILFLSPYYPPENGATSTCVGETAVRLVKQGHEVTVLTTLPNYPTGIVPPEYRGRLLQMVNLSPCQHGLGGDGVDSRFSHPAWASPGECFLITKRS